MDAQLTGSLSMVVQDSAIGVLLQAHAPTLNANRLSFACHPDPLGQWEICVFP